MARLGSLLAAVLLLAAAGGACGGDFAHTFTRVDELRLLAARAEPPEITAGEATSVSALVVSPQGVVNPIEWLVCALPAVPGEGPVNAKCLTQSTDDPWYILRGTGNPFVLSLPADMALHTDEFLGFPDATGGYYLPIRARVGDGTGQQLDAVYRLRYSRDDSPRNHNPAIASVEIQQGGGWATLDDNSPVTVTSGAEVTLRAHAAPGSAEPYTARFPDGSSRPQQEIPSFTWFATAGDFSHTTTGSGGSNALSLVSHFPTGGGPIDLWIVVNDQRGGIDWTHRSLTLK